MTYQEQLKNPKWQKKRLEVLNENNFECSECGSKDTELHVHHTIYRKGNKVWEYENDELACLCKTCHEFEHKLLEDLHETYLWLSRYEKLRLLGYADGLQSPIMSRDGEAYEYGFADYLRNDTDGIIRAYKVYEESQGR